MKNKKNLYFLVPAVLFIWGFIIYRIVDFTSDGEVELAPKTYATPFRETQKNEQYQLQAWYPDPFLKQLTTSDVDVNDEEIVEVIAPPKEEVASEPPLDIQYRGFINESGTDVRIALLVIEGKEVFLKSGEVFQAITLDIIQADSLSIIMEGDKKWVRKE